MEDAGAPNGFADEREWLDYGPTFHQSAGPQLPQPNQTWDADLVSNIYDPDGADYIIGRFENMDTLIGLYQDPNDATDVAMG